MTLSRAALEAMRDNAAENFSEEQIRALANTALAAMDENERFIKGQVTLLDRWCENCRLKAKPS